MSGVLNLSDYRKKPAAKPKPCPEAPRWFCMTCDSDLFKIYRDRSVHCATCGAFIRNMAGGGY